jgi:hypothetical protein
VSIHKTTHYMSQDMGGTFTTFTVVWFADGEFKFKVFATEQGAIIFKKHGVAT